jgi:hypothetical protein
MRSRPQYDLPTAVTFLMAGLGIGSLLAILFSRRPARPVLVESDTDPYTSEQRFAR